MGPNTLAILGTAALNTILDVLPIAIILLFFQLAVLRRKIPNLRRVLVGLVCVVAGLALFMVGLEEALFPLGKTMARQLTDPAFRGAGTLGRPLVWSDYYWVYIFAAAVGFSTTIAEPALIAVALKAREVSGGAGEPWGLRIAVALGVGVSIALGTFRIVTGTPLVMYIIAGYLVVVAQTLFAPRFIVALAYDSGGVTTSTVTVPLVTALGLGLASTVPGRSPLIDGFGLVALASLFPIMAVMGYAQFGALWADRRSRRRGSREPPGKINGRDK